MDSVLQRIGDVTIERVVSKKQNSSGENKDSSNQNVEDSETDFSMSGEELSDDDITDVDELNSKSVALNDIEPKDNLDAKVDSIEPDDIFYSSDSKPNVSSISSDVTIKRKGEEANLDISSKKLKPNDPQTVSDNSCSDAKDPLLISTSEPILVDSNKETEVDLSDEISPHRKRAELIDSVDELTDDEYEETDSEDDVETKKIKSEHISPGGDTTEPIDIEKTDFIEKLAQGIPFGEDTIVKTEIIDKDCSSMSKESTDTSEYDYDITEKLREMGEISVQPVKKGEIPARKMNLDEPESEVSVTAAKKPGSDTDDEEQSGVERKIGNLRRNIREVMDETKLDEATLAAQRQEMERLRRVQEQQRIIREVQRQIAFNRQNSKNQQRVVSLLQGNSTSTVRPSGSGVAGGQCANSRMGNNTVLVKLPNGETKSMTRVPKGQNVFEMIRTHKSINLQHNAQNRSGAPNRNLISGKSGHITPSVSIAPVAKKQPSTVPTNEADKGLAKSKKDVETIDVSSSDDDCIVLSEEDEEPEPEEDPSNSGMHTNDAYNVPDEQGRVLINVGHPENEPDIFLAPQIARVIKPHQIGGVRFLYDNVIESIERFNTSTGFGCILAHSMGLGKTLQVVCFSDIFLRHTTAKTILCIMPINTLQNWVAEFNMWLPVDASNSPLQAHGEVRPRNFNLHVLNDSHKSLTARAKIIQEWNKDGGVLLIGYELYRLLSLKRNSRTKRKKKPTETAVVDLEEDDKNKALFDEIHEALVKPGPDLVICDEGHRIKNSHASISQALKQIRSKRRVVLTGYPLQNNLLEYWCMVDFVRPNYLGTKTEFSNMFERPIQNGQCVDSTPQDVRLMRFRAHVLHSLLEGFVQRRSHAVLQVTLPQKEEYVMLVRMTAFQRKLYDTFMNDVVRTKTVPNPLKAFAVCCKIWNHPDVLYYFLKKREESEAVADIDLEEVAGVPGAGTTVDTNTTSTSTPKRSRAKGGKTGTPRRDNRKSKQNTATSPASTTASSTTTSTTTTSTVTSSAMSTTNTTNTDTTMSVVTSSDSSSLSSQPTTSISSNLNSSNQTYTSPAPPPPTPTPTMSPYPANQNYNYPPTPASAPDYYNQNANYPNNQYNNPQFYPNNAPPNQYGTNTNYYNQNYANYNQDNWSNNWNNTNDNQPSQFGENVSNQFPPPVNNTNVTPQYPPPAANNQYPSSDNSNSSTYPPASNTPNTQYQPPPNAQPQYPPANPQYSTDNSNSSSQFPPRNTNTPYQASGPPTPQYSPSGGNATPYPPPGNTPSPYPPGNANTVPYPPVNSPQFGPGNTATSFTPGNVTYTTSNTATSFGSASTTTSFTSGNTQKPFTPGNTATSYAPGNTTTSYTSGSAAVSYTQGNTTTSYTPGNTQTSYASGITTTSYTSSNTATSYPPGNTTTSYTPGNTASSYATGNTTTSYTAATSFGPGNTTTSYTPGNTVTSFAPAGNTTTTYTPGSNVSPYPASNATSTPYSSASDTNTSSQYPPASNVNAQYPQNSTDTQYPYPGGNIPGGYPGSQPYSPRNANDPQRYPQTGLYDGNVDIKPNVYTSNTNVPPYPSAPISTNNPLPTNTTTTSSYNMEQKPDQMAPNTYYPPANTNKGPVSDAGQPVPSGPPPPIENGQFYPQPMNTNAYPNVEIKTEPNTIPPNNQYYPNSNPMYPPYPGAPPPNQGPPATTFDNPEIKTEPGTQPYYSNPPTAGAPPTNYNYYPPYSQQPMYNPNPPHTMYPPPNPPNYNNQFGNSAPPAPWPQTEIKDEKQPIKTEIKSETGEIKTEVKAEVKDEVKQEDESKPQAQSDTEVKTETEKSENTEAETEDGIKDDETKTEVLPTAKLKEDAGINYDWAVELLKGYVPGCIENSAKMEILFCIIRESMALGDRILLFSQSLFTLNLIEEFLQRYQVPGHEEKWARNVNYYRLDGSTSALEREKLINEFNANNNIHLFMVSTRAGSLGINLVGANRVVVFDASWNPCHDTQAVCRVYRYGQKKPCFVYRLVMDNCLEKKIYDRQINKQGMSDRVVDECNPDAHLSLKDVTNLCWDDEKETEIKDFSHSKDKYIDIVMQKVLENHSHVLSREPFQHESLLVDRKEKKLSQAEKRMAKRSYEMEKQAVNNAARSATYSYHGGIGTGMIHRGMRMTSDGSIHNKPIASVRPMQAELNSQLVRDGQRRTRWIPAEVWQRQGMTAQEMTLPLDVVIPTNGGERGNIVLKAGQKVLVLKSPKGIYMQLECGKIVAIRTAMKMRGNASTVSQGGKISPGAGTPKSSDEGSSDGSLLKKCGNQRTNIGKTIPLPLKNNSAVTITPKTNPGQQKLVKPFTQVNAMGKMTKTTGCPRQINARIQNIRYPNKVNSPNIQQQKAGVQLAKAKPFNIANKTDENSSEMKSNSAEAKEGNLIDEPETHVIPSSDEDQPQNGDKDENLSETELDMNEQDSQMSSSQKSQDINKEVEMPMVEQPQSSDQAQVPQTSPNQSETPSSQLQLQPTLNQNPTNLPQVKPFDNKMEVQPSMNIPTSNIPPSSTSMPSMNTPVPNIPPPSSNMSPMNTLAPSNIPPPSSNIPSMNTPASNIPHLSNNIPPMNAPAPNNPPPSNNVHPISTPVPNIPPPSNNILPVNANVPNIPPAAPYEITTPMENETCIEITKPIKPKRDIKTPSFQILEVKSLDKSEMINVDTNTFQESPMNADMVIKTGPSIASKTPTVLDVSKLPASANAPKSSLKNYRHNFSSQKALKTTNPSALSRLEQTTSAIGGSGDKPSLQSSLDKITADSPTGIPMDISNPEISITKKTQSVLPLKDGMVVEQPPKPKPTRRNAKKTQNTAPVVVNPPPISEPQTIDLDSSDNESPTKMDTDNKQPSAEMQQTYPPQPNMDTNVYNYNSYAPMNTPYYGNYNPPQGAYPAPPPMQQSYPQNPDLNAMQTDKSIKQDSSDISTHQPQSTETVPPSNDYRRDPPTTMDQKTMPNQPPNPNPQYPPQQHMMGPPPVNNMVNYGQPTQYPPPNYSGMPPYPPNNTYQPPYQPPPPPGPHYNQNYPPYGSAFHRPEMMPQYPPPHHPPPDNYAPQPHPGPPPPGAPIPPAPYNAPPIRPGYPPQGPPGYPPYPPPQGHPQGHPPPMFTGYNDYQYNNPAGYNQYMNPPYPSNNPPPNPPPS